MRPRVPLEGGHECPPNTSFAVSGGDDETRDASHVAILVQERDPVERAETGRGFAGERDK